MLSIWAVLISPAQSFSRYIRTAKLFTFGGPDISTTQTTNKELIAEIAPL